MRQSMRETQRHEYAHLIECVHYAKRWPSVSYAYGLFLDEKIEGVVTFGTPPSSPLRVGLAGIEFSKNVIELNRLVLASNKKNNASMLVSHALRELSKIGNFIVVSFADTSQGHKGIVYQASNFRYYGLSAKRTDWKVKGKEHLHGQTIADEFRGCKNRSSLMKDKYGDDFYLQDRPRKHRYIIAIGSRKFVNSAYSSIRYTQEPFPK